MVVERILLSDAIVKGSDAIVIERIPLSDAIAKSSMCSLPLYLLPLILKKDWF